MTDYQFGCMYLAARSGRDFFQEQTEPKETNLNHEAVPRKDALMHKRLFHLLLMYSSVPAFLSSFLLVQCGFALHAHLLNIQPLRMQPKET